VIFAVKRRADHIVHSCERPLRIAERDRRSIFPNFMTAVRTAQPARVQEERV
jgi:hypothetical protein